MLAKFVLANDRVDDREKVQMSPDTALGEDARKSRRVGCKPMWMVVTCAVLASTFSFMGGWL